MVTIEHILFMHILAGSISLVTGLIALIGKKGNPFHTLVGKIYFLSMTMVFLSAVYVSIVKQNWFLLLIGFFSFYLVFSGIQYSKIRRVEQVKTVDFLRIIFFTICFITMIIWGFWSLYLGNLALAILLLIFGSIGALLNKGDVKLFLLKKNRKDSRSWMKDHIGRMTGSYISAVTAFAVNNITFLPPLLIWLLPTVLGTLVIFYFYSKFGLNKSIKNTIE